MKEFTIGLLILCIPLFLELYFFETKWDSEVEIVYCDRVRDTIKFNDTENPPRSKVVNFNVGTSYYESCDNCFKYMNVCYVNILESQRTHCESMFGVLCNLGNKNK